MFVAIDNTPRDYAWGSREAISHLLARTPSGRPEAELWLGAHKMSPSVIVDPTMTGGARTLDEWIAANPAMTLGGLAELPFLLKALAAQTALSIQVHPSMEQARAGFDRENSLGISVTSPERNYRDASHKPELLFCLSDTFEVLCGFRPINESVETLRGLAHVGTESDLEVARILDLAADVSASSGHLRDVVTSLLTAAPSEMEDLVTQLHQAATLVREGDALMRDASTILTLVNEYPGDPGIVVALLMNRVALRRGEAIFVDHGVLHAYMSGLGIEIMAASDNVLRGGLTSKHIDVGELVAIGNFEPSPASVVVPVTLAPGVDLYAPGVAEFGLVHVAVASDADDTHLVLDGPAIALCTSGQLSISGATSETRVRQGSAVFVTPDEERLHMRGSGELFIARTGKKSHDVAG